MTKTVAVDFDGVIHAYSKGWQDGSIYDKPVPGAFDALALLMKKFAVMVHTTREPASVARWIKEWGGIETCWYADPAKLPQFWDDQRCLLVTDRKLPAVAYIDDRAIRFTNWDQALDDLGRFEPPATPPKTGLDKVAEAVRKARGGDPPAQIRGFAL